MKLQKVSQTITPNDLDPITTYFPNPFQIIFKQHLILSN